MLLAFGGKNIYSFKEGFEINLRLSKNCPKEISKGKNYTNVLALKGANASGKTSVFKAMSFLKVFVIDSFSLKPDEKVPLESFFFNDKKNTSLFATFSQDDIEYTYEVELSHTSIVSESVYEDGKLVIKRVGNNFEKISDKYNELKVIKKIRSNASFISTAKQYEIESIDSIYNFFFSIIINVGYDGLMYEMIDYRKATELYFKEKKIFDFVKKVLIKFDTGIKDIKIHKEVNSETNEDEYFPVFIYQNEDEEEVLIYPDQSSGVRALFKQLGAYKIVLDTGGLLLLDEFDINLHPDILPELIELFEDKKINKYNAQFIFTTHNNDIMESLKKYRVILVNKEDNQSYLYRLDEISGEIVRNDRPIIPLYNSGKLGGKPRIEHEQL